MFRTLDTTGDGSVDAGDIDNISAKMVTRFLGRMKDRFADMADILIDQKIDFHIAREKRSSRQSIVENILGKNNVKDEL